MADSKISDLTAVTTPADTDQFAVNQGGTSKMETLLQVRHDLVQVPTGAGSIIIPGLAGSPDIVPSSPSGYDDEFSALSGWTTLGTLDTLNVTDFASHVHIKRATGAWDVDGIYKTCPSMASSWTVTAKFTDYFAAANYQQCGLMLAEASPGKLYIFGPLYTGSAAIYSTTWTNRTSRSGYESGVVNPVLYQYFRLIVASSTNVTCQISRSGIFWTTIFANRNPNFTIGNVGIAITTNDASGTMGTIVDWIRFT